MEKEYQISIKIKGEKSLIALREILKALGAFTTVKRSRWGIGVWEWRLIDSKDSRKAKTELKSKLRYETAN